MSECADTRVERIRTGGGLLRKTYLVPPHLLWRTLWRTSRAAREYDNLAELQRAGVPSVRPVCWLEDRKVGVVCSSQVFTEYLEGADNLQTARRRTTSRRVLRDYSERMGTLLAQLHASGFCSTTVSPRNVLVTTREFVLCDQPYAVRLAPRFLLAWGRDVDLHDVFFAGSRRRECSKTVRLAGVVAYCGGDRRAARALWRRLHFRSDRTARLRRQVVRLLSPLFRRRRPS